MWLFFHVSISLFIEKCTWRNNGWFATGNKDNGLPFSFGAGNFFGLQLTCNQQRFAFTGNSGLFTPQGLDLNDRCELNNQGLLNPLNFRNRAIRKFSFSPRYAFEYNCIKKEKNSACSCTFFRQISPCPRASGAINYTIFPWNSKHRYAMFTAFFAWMIRYVLENDRFSLN